MSKNKTTDLVGSLKFVGATALSRAFQQGSMLIVLVLTAYVLGPTGRGQIAATVAWAQLAATVAHISLGQVAFHEGIRSTDQNWLKSSLVILVYANIVGSSVVGAVAIALALSDGSLSTGLPVASLALGLAMVPLLIWENQSLYLCSKLGQLPAFNSALNVGRTLSVVAVVAQVLFDSLTAIGALGALCVGQAVSAIILWRGISSGADQPWALNAALARAYVGRALRLHPLALATAIIATNDVLFLQATRTESEAGIYQAASALIAILVTFSQSVQQVSYQLTARDNADKAWRTQSSLFAVVLVWFLACAALLWLIAPDVVHVMYGSRFSGTSPVVRALIPIGLAQVLSNLMTPHWVARGYFWQISTGMTCIAGLAIASNYALVPSYGLEGAIVTSWLVAAAWLTLNLVFALRVTLERPPVPIDTTVTQS